MGYNAPAYLGMMFSFMHVLTLLFFLQLFLFLPSNASADFSSDTMLGYWKFDNNASDSSGHENAGTLNGAPTPTYVTSVPTAMTSFPNSKSINFGGPNSYITIPNDPGVQPAETLTFSMWVYLDSYPASAVVIGGNHSDGNPNSGFYFLVSTSSVSFKVCNGTTCEQAVSNHDISLPLNSWTHLTGTWDGANVKLYSGGTLKNSSAFSGAVTYLTSTFRLGNFSGKMDDVRLYKRALSLAEIADLASGRHTSIVWDGSYSTDYENVENWSLNIVPDPYTLVTIPNVTNKPEFSTILESMAGLQIDAGASLNLHGYNFTMNDAGIFSNNGNLILTNANTQVITGFTNDINSGTVTIEDAESAAALKTGSIYNNLTMSSAGIITTPPAATVVKGNFTVESGTFVLMGNLTVYGNLILSGGTLDVSGGNHTINLLGDWIKSSGQLLARNGNVNLNGGNQSIYGDNTFYSLSKITSDNSDILSFDSTATQVISNNLYLRGLTNKLLNLRSTVTGTQWRIDSQGTSTLSFLDVKDSYNANAEAISVIGNNVTNSGNNAYWIFDANPPVITLDSVSTLTANTQLAITGTANEYSGIVTTIQFQLESAGGGGVWTACVADDGIFDETIEDFSCTPVVALSEGAHIMYIRATDSNGYTNANDSLASANFTVDSTESVISAVAADPSEEEVTISWTTSESASSLVNYGKTSAYGHSSNEFNTISRVTSHSVSITGLEVCTNYNFRVQSQDGVGNQSVSANYTFATEGCSTVDEDICDEIPDSPEITSAQAESSTTIKIKTDEVSGIVDYYKLEYGTSSGNYKWDKDNISGNDVSSITIKNLSPETTYYFRVRAINDCGKGDWSDEESEKTQAAPKIPVTDIENKIETAPLSLQTQGVDLIPGVPLKTEFNGTTSLDWQKKYFGNEFCYEENKCGGQADPDNDGLNNDEEFRLGTNPNNADTDGDGIKDGAEIESGKNPNKISDQQNGDEIIFESPKESGEINKETYKVKNVEMVGEEGNKKLKLSGKGLPNSYVTVFIYSDLPTVLTVKTDKEGNWSYVLDKDLEDGEHQVYVAVTDSDGKIINKSESFSFIKTAQAVSVVAPAEAAALERAAPPTEVWFRKNIFLSGALILSGIILALAAIGLYKHGINKKPEDPEYGFEK